MKPLSGIRVIDLTRVLAGPFCTMILADLGAEVIKIEPPKTGDDARAYGPFIDGKSAYFMSYNRNKKSVTLNLKDQTDKEVLDALIGDAEVLLENFRPGTLARLGFDWERIHRLNPRLVLCHISGFGQTGPYSQWPGYDIVAQAMSGMMSINGNPDDPPTRVGISIGDLGAAVYAALGIMGAVRVAEHTGQGQEVDISLLDCQIALLGASVMSYGATGHVPGREGSRHPSITPFTSLKTGDGYVAIGAGNDKLYHRLCEVLGVPELATDPRFVSNRDRTDHHEELHVLLEKALADRTTAEWVDIFRAEGLPCAPINDISEILVDPQLAARGIVWELPVADGTLGVSGNPIKFSTTPADEVYLYPPELGEHNAEIKELAKQLKQKKQAASSGNGKVKKVLEPVTVK